MRTHLHIIFSVTAAGTVNGPDIIAEDCREVILNNDSNSGTECALLPPWCQENSFQRAVQRLHTVVCANSNVEVGLKEQYAPPLHK